MRKNTEQFDNGHIMLRNRPDKGEALGRVIALGFVLFIVFILYAAMHNTWPDDDRLEQFMSFAAFLLIAAIPLYLCFVLLVKIYWYAFGGETVYYSDSAIYIEQKKAIQREVVIPWESITKVEPYEDCLHYLQNRLRQDKEDPLRLPAQQGATDVCNRAGAGTVRGKFRVRKR